MARTALALQQVVRTGSGLTPSFTAANADGHSVANDGRVFIEVKNTDASPITVTVVTPNTVDSLAITDRTATVAATTGDKMIGPFPKSIYDQSDGTIHVDFSAVSNVTCAAIHL